MSNCFIEFGIRIINLPISLIYISDKNFWVTSVVSFFSAMAPSIIMSGRAKNVLARSFDWQISSSKTKGLVLAVQQLLTQQSLNKSIYLSIYHLVQRQKFLKKGGPLLSGFRQTNP
eukprot:Lithocolla_globosa_v1_NODE_540_length_3787_cov_70.867631.p7 type:complete len:116 gc:universal NODE_540_length_3787_cov_70.867631:2259-2606(+)